MTSLCCEVLQALRGKTLVTAESCTGGGIGAALTAMPGSSEVYKGGVICYTNWVKANVLQVSQDLLENYGAVSASVAEAMAKGARAVLQADVAISVTGLAGPSGDEYGNPIGTVFIGCDMDGKTAVKHFVFSGDRDAVRQAAVSSALQMVLEQLQSESAR